MRLSSMLTTQLLVISTLSLLTAALSTDPSENTPALPNANTFQPPSYSPPQTPLQPETMTRTIKTCFCSMNLAASLYNIPWITPNTSHTPLSEPQARISFTCDAYDVRPPPAAPGYILSTPIQPGLCSVDIADYIGNIDWIKIRPIYAPFWEQLSIKVEFTCGAYDVRPPWGIAFDSIPLYSRGHAILVGLLMGFCAVLIVVGCVAAYYDSRRKEQMRQQGAEPLLEIGLGDDGAKNRGKDWQWVTWNVQFEF